MDNETLKSILVKHKLWLDTDGCKGDKADLKGANLYGADLDFSCLPLWCGGEFIADNRICKQLVAHVLRIMELSGEKNEELLDNMREYKAGWHRENEYGGEK